MLRRLTAVSHFWLSLEEEVSWSSRSDVVIKHGQASTVYVRKSQIPTIFSKQEPQSPLISWADPFPSRFINRTIVKKLLLPAVIYLFSLALFLYHCAKPGSIWCSSAQRRWDKEKSYGQKSASDALMLFSLWAILSLQKEMVKELTTLTCTSMYACSCTKYGITRAFFDLCLIGCLEAKPIKTQDKYLQPAQSTGNI